jgi:hypothetical protein
VAAGEEGEKSREWWEDSQLRERGKREKGKRKMRARELLFFRRRIKERLTHGSSSSVKIINCDRDGNELVIINLIDEVLTDHRC